VYQQHITGLKDKVQKFATSSFPELPHSLCLTEHWFKEDEIDMISNENYNLKAKLCRQILKNGGACIIIPESIKFRKINLHNSCKRARHVDIYC
jgi:hypothetical protein